MIKYLLILVMIYPVAFFVLENGADEKIIMAIEWVDHDFKDEFGLRVAWPVRMMTGEVKSGGEFRGGYNYTGKKFYVNKDRKSKNSKIKT